LLKVKAEISTKCAARTIKKVPFICAPCDAAADDAMDDLGAGAEPVVVDGRVRGDGDDRPVVTLLKVKAEISTKCAARTIKKVPFICSGPWLKARGTACAM
jgi:hypothetical protein